MRAVPQTIGDNLLGRIRKLSRRTEPASTFEIRSLWNQAEQLARVEPVDASLIKAFLASVNWDSESVIYWGDNALSLDKSAMTAVNVAVSRRLAGRLDECVDLSVYAAENSNGDLGILDLACEGLFSSGWISKSSEYAAKYRKDSEILKSRFELAEKVLSELQSLQISEEQLREQIHIATKVAMEMKIRVVEVGMGKFSFEDGDTQFLLTMHFPGDIDRELDAEAALAHAFVDLPYWNPQKLDIQYKYYSNEDELLAS